MTKLKIYSDKNWLFGASMGALMEPFWGSGIEAPHQPNTLLEYSKIGHQFFEVVSEENADVAVLPITFEKINLAKLKSITDKLKLKLIVFSCCDANYTIPIDSVICFRYSYNKSAVGKKSIFGFPTFSGDLLSTYTNGFKVLSKTPKPKIGFCGFQSAQIRNTTLSNLEKYGGITTDFVKHREFFAGMTDTAGLMNARRLFTQNIVNNHYTVCTRGFGNFSFRLVETLNCGRIPILVDTDCLLPVDTIIDWKKHCVWLNANEIQDVGEIVKNHYNSYNEEEFISLQKECRTFWKEYLSPEGFFSHLQEIIYQHLR